MLHYNSLDESEDVPRLTTYSKIYFYGSCALLSVFMLIGLLYPLNFTSHHCLTKLSPMIVIQSISTFARLYINWLKENRNDLWKCIHKYHRYLDLIIMGFSTVVYYDESRCSNLDPVPYYTLLGLLIYNYAYVCLLLLAICLALFFTPCYLCIIRPFIDRKNRLSDEEISKLNHSICYQQIDEVECAICLNKITIGNEITTLPCLHQYHYDCIKRWLQIKHTCPVCRKSAKKVSI